jgi:tetratricopeptide (TPR) repeat protein
MMKKTMLFWLLVIQMGASFSQSGQVDSLKLLLQSEKQDTNQVMLLSKIGMCYIFEKPETGIAYLQQGLDLSRTINYKKGEADCLNGLGNLNRMMGNFTFGIKYHLQALQIAEMINDQRGVESSNFGIAGAYEDEGDYSEALKYYYKIKPKLETMNDLRALGGIESSMGLCYFNLGLLDSALKYEQNAYQLQINSPDKAISLARLAKIHSGMNNYDVALSFYRLGIPIAISNSDNNALTELYSGIFTLFEKLHQYDSGAYYGKKELAIAQELGSPVAVADACSDLFSIYKKNKLTDSALKYLEAEAVIRDTLFTREKLKQQQVLAFEEENRQKEKQAELKVSAEKRKENIQFAAIAIGVISFIILFFLISRSIIINANWIRLLGVLALLIGFEFINLAIHPYLSHYTNDSPVLMLSALVIIGALLIPMHHKIEKWVIEKMVEKNKAVRLAAARKTIEQLEKKNNKT